MIALQSFRRSGLLAVLLLCGNSFALGIDKIEAPPPRTSAEASAMPVLILDPGTDSPHPGVPVDCQCRRCCPDSHRSGGFFGWFKGRSARAAIAEYDAMHSGCNVNPEPPFGTSYYATMQLQIAKGEAALMVLHHFDFVPCQGELNFRGQLRLQKIARRALHPHNPFPIIIQASRHDPELDAARHAAVISELAWMPVLAERVVIGSSPARGMDGLDAELIHLNLLRLTEGGFGQPSAPAGGAGAGAPQSR